MKKLEKKINIMRKCKICGLGNIEYDNDTCKICGWEADTIQEENPNYVGGANNMTYNQHVMFWEYKKNFQSINEEILRKEEAGEIIQEIK